MLRKMIVREGLEISQENVYDGFAVYRLQLFYKETSPQIYGEFVEG